MPIQGVSGDAGGATFGGPAGMPHTRSEESQGSRTRGARVRLGCVRTPSTKIQTSPWPIPSIPVLLKLDKRVNWEASFKVINLLNDEVVVVPVKRNGPTVQKTLRAQDSKRHVPFGKQEINFCLPFVISERRKSQSDDDWDRLP